MGDDGVTRRDVLKGLGVAGAGVLGAGSSAITADGVEPAGGTLDIAIYKQRESDAEGARNVRDSLRGFMLELQDHNAIGEANVWVEEMPLRDGFGLTYTEGECDDGRWFTAFRDAVAEAYEADIHLVVTGQSRFATAGRGECWGDNGPGFGYIGTAGGYADTAGPEEDVKRYENVALQEVGHLAINEAHIPGAAYLDHPEHALGTIVVDTPPGEDGAGDADGHVLREPAARTGSAG